MDWLIEKLCEWDPESRRKTAMWMLLVTLILGHLNIAAFVFGFVPNDVMDAITNYLSWLALSITAWDVVVGSDVRVQQEEEG